MPHGKGTYGSTKGRPPKRQTGKKNNNQTKPKPTKKYS